MARAWLACLLAAALTGCSDDDLTADKCRICEEGRPNHSEPGDGGGSGADAAGESLDGAGEFASEEEEGGDTGEPCCYGDGIRHVANGDGYEVVDIEQEGAFSITCGGFGGRVDHLDADMQPTFLGEASSRCQNIAFGAELDGAQTFYLSHHGDSWVSSPHLSVYRIEADLSISNLQQIHDESRAFEGLEWRDGRLFVTLHGGGLQVFDTTSPEADLVLIDELSEGFDNAVEIDVDAAGEYAYLADGGEGVKVVHVAAGEPMQIVATIETGGLARHVEVDGGRLYTALGGSGVVIHDVEDPHAPVELARIEDRGSAQQVAVEGDLLAVAAWSHLALYDRNSLELLGTERVRSWPEAEQDLAVDISGQRIFLGEWLHSHILEYEAGLDAPDLWLDESLYDFVPDEPGERTVLVENRGTRDLVISKVWFDPQETFSSNVQTPLTVAPGAKAAFQVGYVPPSPTSQEGEMVIESDDPDEDHPFGGHRTRLLVRNTSALNVGDQLDEQFGFLDPSGEVSALEGQVLVLAYFALF